MKRDGLVVVVREKHLHWYSLMGDGPQQEPVQGVGGDRLRQRNPFYLQLPGQLFIYNGDVGARVYEHSKGMGAPW